MKPNPRDSEERPEDAAERPVEPRFVPLGNRPPIRPINAQAALKLKYDARLTVVEHIYHSRKDGSQTQQTASYERFLDTNEQGYGPRELQATSIWQKVDCGWVKKASVVLIVNKTNPKNMSKEEREETTLELVLGDDPSKCIPWLLLPGESLRGLPSQLEYLHIRARCAGYIEYTVTALPE